MPIKRVNYRSRRGSFLVEVVIAAALFATAAIALGRLTRTASSISLQADQRLSAQFVAENTLARLNAIPFADLEESSQRVAEAISKDSGLSVTINTEKFALRDSADESALHLVVQVDPGITLHDWRIKEERDD